MKRVVAIVISLIVVISSAAQDIEQLAKADLNTTIFGVVSVQ